MGEPELVVAISLVGGRLTVGLDTAHLDRADFFLDGYPVASLALQGRPLTTTVPDVRPGQTFRVVAFRSGKPVAIRRLIT
jgi:hypothetical protein